MEPTLERKQGHSLYTTDRVLAKVKLKWKDTDDNVMVQAQIYFGVKLQEETVITAAHAKTKSTIKESKNDRRSIMHKLQTMQQHRSNSPEHYWQHMWKSVLVAVVVVVVVAVVEEIHWQEIVLLFLDASL